MSTVTPELSSLMDVIPNASILHSGHNYSTSLIPSVKRHRSADGSLESSPNNDTTSSQVEQSKLLSAVANISITSPIDPNVGIDVDSDGDSIKLSQHSDRDFAAIVAQRDQLQVVNLQLKATITKAEARVTELEELVQSLSASRSAAANNSMPLQEGGVNDFDTPATSTQSGITSADQSQTFSTRNKNRNKRLRSGTPKEGQRNNVAIHPNLSEIGGRLAATLTKLQEQVDLLSPLGQVQSETCRRKSSSKGLKPNAVQAHNSSTSATSKAPRVFKPKVVCRVCGRLHSDECRFLLPDGTSWHPNANLTSMPWSNSVQGIQYLQKTKLHTLAFTIDADGNRVMPPADNPVHNELRAHFKH